MPKTVAEVLSIIDDVTSSDNMLLAEAKSFLDELSDEIQVRLDAMESDTEEEEVDGSEATE
jgi:hypothetical protein